MYSHKGYRGRRRRPISASTASLGDILLSIQVPVELHPALSTELPRIYQQLDTPHDPPFQSIFRGPTRRRPSAGYAARAQERSLMVKSGVLSILAALGYPVRWCPFSLTTDQALRDFKIKESKEWHAFYMRCSYRPPWTPERHRAFDAAFRERVRLLLMAWRWDAGSLLYGVPFEPCLRRIIELVAANDAYLE